MLVTEAGYPFRCEPSIIETTDQVRSVGEDGLEFDMTRTADWGWAKDAL
jgi:hypothetical protein